METTRLSVLKKGEYFRFEGKKTVYVFKGGGKVRGFNYEKDEDINSFYTSKKDKIVEIGFTY